MGNYSKKYSKKSGQSKKYIQKNLKKTSDLNYRTKVKIPITPPLPNRNKMNKIKRKNIGLLNSLESQIIVYCRNDSSISDRNILRILAKLMWELEEWSTLNVYNASTIIHKKTEIALKPEEQIFYDSLLHYAETIINNSTISILEKHFGKINFWDSLAYTFKLIISWTQRCGRKGYINFVLNQSYDHHYFLKFNFVKEFKIEKYFGFIFDEYSSEYLIKKLSQKRKKYQKSYYSRNELEGYAALSDAILTITSLSYTIENQKYFRLTKKMINLIKKVCKHLEKALKKLPEISEIYTSLILGESVLEKFDKAEDYYLQARENFPEDCDINLTGGIFYFKTSKYGISIESFQKVFDSSNDIYAIFMEACAYYNMKEFASAIEILEFMLSMDKNNIDINSLIEICSILEKSNNHEGFKEFKASKIDFLSELRKSIYNLDKILFFGNEILASELIKSGF